MITRFVQYSPDTASLFLNPESDAQTRERRRRRLFVPLVAGLCFGFVLFSFLTIVEINRLVSQMVTECRPYTGEWRLK